MNELPTAELALQTALRLEPDSPDAHVLLAFARRDRGDFDGAAAELDEASALGAGVGALRAKALLRVDQGRLDLARAEAEKILQTVPDDGAALWVRARARLAAGDARGAENDLAAVKPKDDLDVFAAKAAQTLRDEILADRARREDALYTK
jgi:tetratricopeptide (TPR) repeat protein